jgi:fermentation-respiration switch protein FrsA (DUF1100 family)
MAVRAALRSLVLFAGVALAIYAAAVGYLFAMQRSYLFAPSGGLDTPQSHGLDGVEDFTFTAADGTQLAGWRAAAGSDNPTVLYFHGNAGALSDRADRFRQIVDSGLGLLAVTYRGYPGSGGWPSQEKLFSDALAIFDSAGAGSAGIVLYGESLGGSVATYVASKRSAAALILEAPFTAALDIAAATYPWVPVSLLMRDPFLSRDYIQAVEEPVLILHGSEDRVVPVDHGRRLFAFAGEPKELAIFDGGGHGDLWRSGLWPKVVDFLGRNDAVPRAE